jgi:cell division septal protein FtsQ
VSPFRSRRRYPSSSYENWNEGPRRRWRPRSRARGCLLWLLILIVVLVVLALMFGGFQKGTKSGSLAPPITSAQGPR